MGLRVPSFHLTSEKYGQGNKSEQSSRKVLKHHFILLLLPELLAPENNSD